jgi:hypothetical protein
MNKSCLRAAISGAPFVLAAKAQAGFGKSYKEEVDEGTDPPGGNWMH